VFKSYTSPHKSQYGPHTLNNIAEFVGIHLYTITTEMFIRHEMNIWIFFGKEKNTPASYTINLQDGRETGPIFCLCCTSLDMSLAG